MPRERFREITAPDDHAKRAVYEGILQGVRKLIRTDEGWRCQGLYARRIHPDASPDFLVPVVNLNPVDVSAVREGSFLSEDVLEMTGRYHRFSRASYETDEGFLDRWYLFPLHDVDMEKHFISMIAGSGLVVVSAYADIEHSGVDFKIHTLPHDQALNKWASRLAEVRAREDQIVSAATARYLAQAEALLARAKRLENFRVDNPVDLL